MMQRTVVLGAPHRAAEADTEALQGQTCLKSYIDTPVKQDINTSKREVRGCVRHFPQDNLSLRERTNYIASTDRTLSLIRHAHITLSFITILKLQQLTNIPSHLHHRQRH